MTDIMKSLIERDLIQFGHFGVNAPIRFRLDLLPAYPDVLQAIAIELQLKLSQSMAVDRIVCTSDAIAPALATSLQSGIPLVYSLNTDRAPVHDLVGAYDVGHPAALVTLVLVDLVDLTGFIQRMKRVGLETQHVYSIVSLADTDHLNGIPITTLIDFADLKRAAPGGRGMQRDLDDWRSAQIGQGKLTRHQD